MLVKHDRQSDGRSYGRVVIHGNVALKGVYMGAAHSIIVGKECELKHSYLEDLAKGLDPKAAKKNLERRVAAISLSIMKSKQPYREGFIQPGADALMETDLKHSGI